MNVDNKCKTSNYGFSLVELIVVVLIMGILTVVLTPTVMQWLDKSRIAVDRNSLAAVKSAASLTFMDEGIFSSSQGKKITITIKDDTDGTKIEAPNTILSTNGRSVEQVFEEHAGATIYDFVFKKVHMAVLVYVSGSLKDDETVIPTEFSNDLQDE